MLYQWFLNKVLSFLSNFGESLRLEIYRDDKKKTALFYKNYDLSWGLKIYYIISNLINILDFFIPKSYEFVCVKRVELSRNIIVGINFI